MVFSPTWWTYSGRGTLSSAEKAGRREKRLFRADKPYMGVRLQPATALETIDFCAGVRESIAARLEELRDKIARCCSPVVDRIAPPVLLVVVAAAICGIGGGSRRRYNPMADLSDTEYKRRYELGRQRYYADRAARKALRKLWLRDHGPWLLLVVIAILLMALLGLTQPHRFIVIATLALYAGLTWVVCWAVRASC